MSEQILIKSQSNISLKKCLTQLLPLIGIVIVVTILLACEYPIGSYTEIGWYIALEYWDFMGIAFFIIFLIGCFSLLGIIIMSVIFFLYRECELQITDKNIKGKTILGNEIILPLYMVSSYSTRKCFSVISVSTSSGNTKFLLIKNYKEIGAVLSKLINERQENTIVSSQTSETTNMQIDDIVKLKSLLDQGIITQEEFDVKKKEILHF